MKTSRLWLRHNRPTWWFSPSLLALALLTLCSTLTAGEAKPDLGRTYFNKQYYEEAAPLLEQTYRKSGKLSDAKTLAITYYYLLDYERAVPLLDKVVTRHPKDIESRQMLAEMLLALKKYDEVDPHLRYLHAHASDHYMSWILIARRQVTKREIGKAIKSYEHACRLNPNTPVPYSVELLMLYIENGDQVRARALARLIINRSPEAFEISEIKVRLEAMTDYARQSRFRDTPYNLQLGYLLENDNYLLVEPDRVQTTADYEREADSRHVFSLKATARRPLERGKELYGEANLTQSLHNNRDEYDQFQQSYVGGIHWSLGSYGIRLPLSYTHADLDKHFYHQSHSITPEAYWCLNNTTTLHGILRLQYDDYRDGAVDEEQRDGKTSSASILYRRSFQRERVQGNVMYTLSKSNSTGDNWDYMEQLLYTYLNYYYSNRLVGRLYLSHGKQDFENSHSTLGIVRNDNYNNASIALSYWMNRNLELLANWMWIDRRSNIELYDYTRQVAGLGLNWHF